MTAAKLFQTCRWVVRGPCTALGALPHQGQCSHSPDNAQKAVSSGLMPLCHLLLAAFVYYRSSDNRLSLLCCLLCRSQRRLVPSSSCCHGNEISESECLIYSTNWGSSWHCFDLFIIPQSRCLTIQPLLDSLDH